MVSNVESAAGSLGIDYPVAVDDNLATWDAYNNEYWPAEYLIDPTGIVRAYDFGEGGYSSMEDNIRMLLTANGVTDLPARTDVPDKTPTNDITPESYVGDERLDNAVGTAVVPNKAIVYHPPSTIPSNSLAFGGTWTVHNEEATAGNDATLGLQFTADDVYLVMSGDRHGRGVVRRETPDYPDDLGDPQAVHVVLRHGAANRHPDADGVARRRGLRLHVRVARRTPRFAQCVGKPSTTKEAPTRFEDKAEYRRPQWQGKASLVGYGRQGPETRARATGRAI